MLSKLLASAVIVLAVAFAGTMYVSHNGCPLSSGCCPMADESAGTESTSYCDEKPACCEEKVVPSACYEEKITGPAAVTVATPTDK